jgi:hypothetical protein
MTVVTHYAEIHKMNTRQFTVVATFTCLLFSILMRTEGIDLQDSFYLEDKTGKSHLHMTVKDSQGKEHQFAVIPYTNLVGRSIAVYSLKPAEDAWQVQINVVSSDSEWSKKPIVLVVQGKPYFELAKSGSVRGNKGTTMSASVSLKLPTEAEAKFVRERLSKRFRLERQ